MMFPLLVLILITRMLSCSPPQKAPPPYQSGLVIPVKTNLMTAVQCSFQGFNTAQLFTSHAGNNDLYAAIKSDIQPVLLRFPGGTIANFAHPKGPGYGLIPSENKLRKQSAIYPQIERHLKNQSAESENFVEPFIQICRQNAAHVLLVANILTAPVEETLSLLDRLQSEGIVIEGIELGNELYLPGYKDMVNSVEDYIRIAKPFAMAVRKKYPEMKISVPAESKGIKKTGFKSEWNEKLSKEKFYDAVSLHVYADFTVCNSQPVPCYLKNINQFVSSVYPVQLQNFITQFPHAKIWITEWNIFKPSETFGNTFLHSIYSAFFLFENLSNKQSAGKVPVMIFHNLASSEPYYSLIAKEGKGSLQFTSNYYFFKMLGKLKRKDLKISKSTLNDTNGNLMQYTFLSEDMLWVFIINSGPDLFENITFDTSQVPSFRFVKQEVLSGNPDDGVKSKGNIGQQVKFSESSKLNPALPPYSISCFTFSR